VVATHAIDGNFYCHLWSRAVARTPAAECSARGGTPGAAEIKMTVCKEFAAVDKQKAALRQTNTLHRFLYYKKTRRRLLVVLGLQYFTTTVETVRADVVTQVRLARRWLDAQLWSNEEIVRTVHTALRRGLLVLLNCHD
jgi:hypothetical protein